MLRTSCDPLVGQGTGHNTIHLDPDDIQGSGFELIVSQTLREFGSKRRQFKHPILSSRVNSGSIREQCYFDSSCGGRTIRGYSGFYPAAALVLKVCRAPILGQSPLTTRTLPGLACVDEDKRLDDLGQQCYCRILGTRRNQWVKVYECHRRKHPSATWLRIDSDPISVRSEQQSTS